MGRARIGLSGWSYEKWRGDFYPEDLPRDQDLRFASERFSTLEINASFYSLRSPDTYRRWYGDTPRDFVFAVKGSRYITHSKKLKDPRGPLANFLASGVLALGEKLGPILWQLQASFTPSHERLHDFLDLLPHDHEEAAALARDHDERVEEPFLEVERNHRLRHVVELRSPDAFDPETVRVVRDTGTSLAVSDAADFERVEELTSGFVYVRLHGSRETYVSRYTGRELEEWAEKIRVWREGGQPDDARRITERKPPERKGRDVYVYFDNDAEGHAPRDAARLAGMVEG